MKVAFVTIRTLRGGTVNHETHLAHQSENLRISIGSDRKGGSGIYTYYNCTIILYIGQVFREGVFLTEIVYVSVGRISTIVKGPSAVNVISTQKNSTVMRIERTRKSFLWSVCAEVSTA